MIWDEIVTEFTVSRPITLLQMACNLLELARQFLTVPEIYGL
jgi:hypothetical protein